MKKKNLPTDRQALIIRWLKKERSLTIKQLMDKFGVSAMTIHRDLTSLQTVGKVKKVHGGVVLAQMWINDEGKTAVCSMCSHKLSSRTYFIVTWAGGEQSTFCCPHCGLLALHGEEKTAVSALTSDFLYGRMINIYQAHFIINSDVRLCCIPSTICFATAADAKKFQHGFNGQVMALTEAAAHLITSHHAQKGHGSFSTN